MSKEKKDSFQVIPVSTASELMIEDKETGETYSLIQAVCNIWNELREIKKAVA